MSQLAVDIVLLPSIPVMQKIISLIEYDVDSVIQLNTQDCLPHISLAMGVLDEGDIQAVGEILQGFSRRAESIELKLSTTRTNTVADGKHIGDGAIEHIAELTDLHLEIIEAVRPSMTRDNVQAEMFFSPPKVADISTTWVRDYPDDERPEDFRPHITLGEGEVLQPHEPIVFFAERLALCHMGNYCTCRKVLFDTKLRGATAEQVV